MVRGDDGLDEITTTGTSTVIETDAGNVRDYTLDPASLGLSLARPEHLAGGDAEANAGVARSVLSGRRGPARDIVLLNAAAALTVAGKSPDLAGGLALAAASVDEGRAAAVLERWVEFSNDSPAHPSGRPQSP